MLWLLTSPKNSNRSFSFLSEKKSNFVKALDHLEASQQQSINISIEEGDAACGAQLGCGPARGQPMNYIWQNVVSLSFYVLWIHVMVVGFQFCRHGLEPDKHTPTLRKLAFVVSTLYNYIHSSVFYTLQVENRTFIVNVLVTSCRLYSVFQWPVVAISIYEGW